MAHYNQLSITHVLSNSTQRKVMAGIYLKVLLCLLLIFVQLLSKCLRACFVLGAVHQTLINLLSCPWKTKYHYHVFWSFDISFLLNQLSCVMCSFVYKLPILEPCGVWSPNPGLEWAWSPRSWGQLLDTCFSQQLCPSVGFLPPPSTFWPLLCISVVQNPEGTCLTTRVAAVVLTGPSPVSGFAAHLMNGPPMDWVSLPPPIYTLPHTAPRWELLQPKGKFPFLFCI